MIQKKDELAIEFMRRVVSNLNCEQESLLLDLPTIEAVLEYGSLWSVYDTDLMCGIEESIQDGADPRPLIDFVEKYDLKWQLDWITQ